MMGIRSLRFISFAFAICAPVFARAASGLTNPLKSDTLSGFLNDILTLVIEVGAIVVVLMLVYVGFLFVTARGEPGKITTARTALLWTVVGALILLGAQAISLGIQATVGALGATS